MQDQAPIYFDKQGYEALQSYLDIQQPSKVVVLSDDNTEAHCLTHFYEHINFEQEPISIAIPPGEDQKHMGTCMALLAELTNQGLDRKSLMINLGGGVITDLGGFVASIFKRGIDYINVPTSLLAIVDASIGGKTGVDLEHLKNQIGVINQSQMVLIDPNYLKTLPKNQLHSGFAEMIKHGLISTKEHWIDVQKVIDNETIKPNSLIKDSISVKHAIVEQDPKELGIRKALNYGHTLGHAIESFCLSSDAVPTLLHGEAIAIGMVLETYISTQLMGFPERELDHLVGIIAKLYPKVAFKPDHIEEIIEFMSYDKKNVNGQVNFVLLEDIGAIALDCEVDNDLILSAFDYYHQGL
ncbi:MAG: 3-dehydroquinate synthase [Gilvibacter sp.]